MTTHLGTDLDATIAAAVSARIEAEVTKALAGDEVIGAYVVAALTQEVDAFPGDRYSRDKTSFLGRTLRTAIQKATQDAVARILVEEAPAIEDLVRKSLRSEASAIAGQLVQSLTDIASKGYGISISLRGPS